MEYKRKERGQSIVEFVLILPVLLIVLAGVLDLGRLYYAHVAIADAAAEGASYAAIHPNETAGIVDRAQDASGGMVEIDENLVEVSPPPAVASGAPITVTVNYTFTVATPFISSMVPDGVLMLRAVATEVILAGGI
ncbi:MAG: TadE/TadG family type IV pilus assembly protein [Chloroflexota bacterium]|nr:TadE/TadG family type IV pilus assembly protein [Chloroflexota bacterium]